MPSTKVILAYLAGTGNPTWAIYTINAIYLIYIDFPE
jgi:hypothetical protein